MKSMRDTIVVHDRGAAIEFSLDERAERVIPNRAEDVYGVD